MTLVKVTSHLYWLARPWQTPASFLPARGRINNPSGIGPDDPIGPGSVTAFPQLEQKRAPPGKDDPQPAQNEAIRHLPIDILNADRGFTIKENRSWISRICLMGGKRGL